MNNFAAQPEIATEHEGLVFLADEEPFDGAKYARLDLARRRVVSWHSVFPAPCYSERGSHKRLRKAYEAKYGKLEHSGEFPFIEGRLHDCKIVTQKQTTINSLFGGQKTTKGGRKYDGRGRGYAANL